jgi:membrane-associated protein
MITDLLDDLGGMGTAGLCLVVALLAFSETAILIDLLVPGEVGLVLAGAAAADGGHPVALVAMAAATGALAGDTLSYTIGRRWGRPVIDRFELTRRRLSPAVARSERYFARHGGRAVFIARWVGALRAVVPFVAGLSRLRFASFLAWNAAASVTWASFVVLAGFWFGRPVARVVDDVGLGISVAVVVTAALVWRHRRRSRRGTASTDSPPS